MKVQKEPQELLLYLWAEHDCAWAETIYRSKDIPPFHQQYRSRDNYGDKLLEWAPRKAIRIALRIGPRDS